MFVAYCLNAILQKLNFSKSHFSETPQEQYDHAIFLLLMSPKKCLKMFENQFTNKIIMSKNHFEEAFCICKGGNPNTLKLKIKQICGIEFGAHLFIQNFVLVWCILDEK